MYEGSIALWPLPGAHAPANGTVCILANGAAGTIINAGRGLHQQPQPTGGQWHKCSDRRANEVTFLHRIYSPVSIFYSQEFRHPRLTSRK